MPKIRVLRILEYTYDSVETMEADQARWFVGLHGVRRYRHMSVKSATLPLEVLEDTSDSND